MRRVIVIGIKADGSVVLLSATSASVSVGQVLTDFHKARSSGVLPAGFIRLEAFDSDEGRIGVAIARAGAESETTVETKNKKTK